MSTRSKRRDAVSPTSATGFDRHGVEANCVATPLSGTEATHLAAIAEDLKADLIVAGAFGHSRLREWAFGGVTRDLLLSGPTAARSSRTRPERSARGAI